MAPAGSEDGRRAYVIEDDRLMRETVERMLAEARIDAAGFGSCEAFLDHYEGLPAGCIILDLHLPGMGGLELLEAIAAERAAFPVIVLSGTGSVPSAMRAGQLGVIDFIEKPFRMERLLAAAEKAFERLGRLDLAAVRALRRLTPREKELLAAFADGASNKAAAHRLGLSVRTVEVYRANLLHKLGVGSVTRAVLIARESGYV